MTDDEKGDARDERLGIAVTDHFRDSSSQAIDCISLVLTTKFTANRTCTINKNTQRIQAVETVDRMHTKNEDDRQAVRINQRCSLHGTANVATPRSATITCAWNAA